MSYWQDAHRTLYNGNCRTMTELSDESIQMCVTSPPYWGLRKYAGEQESIWGGTPDCSHEWGESITDKKSGGPPKLSYELNKHYESSSQFCSLCGAWRGAYGLDPTPALYVAHTVEILREIRRVLRKDGVVFWNIDDSYAGSGGPGSQYDNKATEKGKEFEKFGNPNRGKFNSIKAKDLCLIPFRVAIAAQEDGWYVRSVIIWNKPNPMPESVTDRPTGSHEYILMLTKSAKYYWGMEAVRIKFAESTLSRVNYPTGMNGKVSEQIDTKIGGGPPQGKDFTHLLNNGGANLRDVWEFPTQSYRGAHFATFPEKLPELCIKAASKENDVVLDPFCGSGTVLEVAAKLNRKAVGYEISEEYCKLIIERNNQSVLL